MPNRPEMRVEVTAAISDPTLPRRDDESDDAGRETQLAHEEHDDDRERHVREEVRGCRAAGLGPEVRVAEDEAQALLQLCSEARLLPVDGVSDRGLLVLPDPDQEEPRADVAQRVDEDRIRGGEGLDEESGKSRPADLGRGAADFHLRVALDDLLALDERGQERHVRDVEEDRAGPREKSDDVQLTERQHVHHVGDRDADEERCTTEVTRDQDRSAPPTVDPHPGGQREQDEGEEVDDSQCGHLERARVEDEDRDEGDGEKRDLRPELADRLGRPELEEVTVAPQPAGRPDPTHRHPPVAARGSCGRAPASRHASRLPDPRTAGSPRRDG